MDEANWEMRDRETAGRLEKLGGTRETGGTGRLRDWGTRETGGPGRGRQGDWRD